MSGRVSPYCPLCGSPTELRERYGLLRPVCTKCDHTVFFDPKVAVVVLVLDADKVLLVKRGVDPGKGLWALPAGFVDAGEDPQSAACREVSEETGLTVNIERLLDVFYSPPGEDGLADIIIAYAASSNGGTLSADDDADEVAWFTADALPELGFRTTHILLGRWREKQV